VALAQQPKGRPAWEQTVLDAATVLCPGGALYVAGGTRSGIKSAARFMDRVFGGVDVLAYGGRSRVLRAVRGQEVNVPASDYYDWRTAIAESDGQRLRFVTKPGLFSWKRLDAGTKLLIETLGRLPLGAHDRVLDIGCGSGVLTLLAAKQAVRGQVLGVDVDCRAVEATRRTLALNDVAHAQALLSDCGESVGEDGFDAVVSNPPFHRAQATTYAVAEQIIRDAHRLLRPGGRLLLVANSFLRYQPFIEDTFGCADIVAQTGQYKVWGAVKAT
jgi:16S rRNA (guanine1207-N2)-methyltransferase